MWENFPWSNGNEDHAWHWVAGQGYNENNGDFLFAALDPDGSSSTTWYNWANNEGSLAIVIYQQQ